MIGRMKAVNGVFEDQTTLEYLILPENRVEKDVIDPPGYPVIFGSEPGPDIHRARSPGDEAPKKSRILIAVAVPGVSFFVRVGDVVSVPEVSFFDEMDKDRVIFAQIEVPEQHGGLVTTGRSQKMENSVDFVVLPASDPLEPRHVVLIIPLRDLALLTASLQKVQYLRMLRGACIGMRVDKKEPFAADGCGSCHDETGIGEVKA